MTQSPFSDRMTREELRAAASLALIFFLRMLGLFLLLPVFSAQAIHLRDATLQLIGIAAGAYGLTQALFQIPFGALSDRFGRKPAIAAGLLLFAAGSATAALADSIYGVIAGRALQGAGAISAAVMALAADLTRERQRTRAMAAIGMSIGLAFALAFVIAPALAHGVGLQGVFWSGALLAAAAIALLYWQVPDPPRSRRHRECEADARHMGAILSDRELLRLNAGIFCLHAILIATFVALPLVLLQEAGLPLQQHWRIYLPVLLLSVAFTLPFLRRADGKGSARKYYLGAIAALGASELGLSLGHGSLIHLSAALVLFFTAFNFLEAGLPALVSRAAPADRRGTALGVYASCQFLGTFVGGLCGGWLSQAYGLGSVFLFCAAGCVAWWLYARAMREPEPAVAFLLPVANLDEPAAGDLKRRLLAVAGVKEAVVVAEEGVAYLKVDLEVLDRSELDAIAQASG